MNKKVVTIGLCSAIVLGGAVSAYGYSAHNWFKSNKQVYLETESKNILGLIDSAEKKSQNILAEFKPFLTDTFHSKQEITADISTGQSTPDPNTLFILDILKKTKIVVESSQDPADQTHLAKVELTLNGAKPVTLEAFMDKEKFSLGLPTFYNKNAVAKYSDSEKIKQRLGMDVPKQALSNNDLLDVLITTKDELKPIYEPYAKLYADSLTAEQVTKADNTFTQGDTSIKGKTYTVSFTQEQYKSLVTKFADQLAQDDKLADLLYTKVSKLATYSGTTEAPSKDDLKNSLKEHADSMKEGLSDPEAPKTITMKVFVDKNGILERTISTNKQPDVFNIASWTTADKATNFSLKIASDEGNLALSYKMKPQDDKVKKGTLSVVSKNTGLSSTSEAKFDMDVTLTKDAPKESAAINFNMVSTENGETNQFSGSITADAADSTDKNHTFNGAITIQGNSSDVGLSDAKLVLKTTGSYDIGNPVVLPTLDASTSLDLGTATEEDISNLEMELQKGFGKYLNENPSLMQMFMPFLLGMSQ